MIRDRVTGEREREIDRMRDYLEKAERERERKRVSERERERH